MAVNSWLHLRGGEQPGAALPADLRERDPLMGGRDCGWVDQMTPFVRSHASPDGWIVDPFCGFGSTLVAAWHEGVRAAGVDIDAHRAGLARERLDRLGAHPRTHPVLAGSLADPWVREQLAAPTDGAGPNRRFTLCLTNVPYFGGACAPGDDGQLYGEAHYEPYLQGLREVFAGVHDLLEPGGWCVAMAQNLRLGGTFVPLAWDLARLLGERFTPHEERVILYDRAADPDPRATGPTNRAHEYALVCRKQPAGIDTAAGCAWLDQLAAEGFAFVLYGSFARRLAGESAVSPNDIDLLCPPDDAEVSRLMRWLVSQGFRIESWNAQVQPPVPVAVFAHRHYFRARRLHRDGIGLQVDIAIAADRAAFDGALARARPAGGPHPVLVPGPPVG